MQFDSYRLNTQRLSQPKVLQGSLINSNATKSSNTSGMGVNSVQSSGQQQTEAFTLKKSFHNNNQHLSIQQAADSHTNSISAITAASSSLNSIQNSHAGSGQYSHQSNLPIKPLALNNLHLKKNTQIIQQQASTQRSNSSLKVTQPNFSQSQISSHTVNSGFGSNSNSTRNPQLRKNASQSSLAPSSNVS